MFLGSPGYGHFFFSIRHPINVTPNLKRLYSHWFWNVWPCLCHCTITVVLCVTLVSLSLLLVFSNPGSMLLCYEDPFSYGKYNVTVFKKCSCVPCFGENIAWLFTVPLLHALRLWEATDCRSYLRQLVVYGGRQCSSVWVVQLWVHVCYMWLVIRLSMYTVHSWFLRIGEWHVSKVILIIKVSRLSVTYCV